MTREELEMDWVLSSYNEGKMEQLDYYMNLRKSDIGDIAYLYLHEDKKLMEMQIVNIIARSDDPKYYDELLENDDVLIDGEEKYNADTSAEFIMDYNCYLVWFKYSPKYKWIIAKCNTDGDGIDVYRFHGTVQQTKEKLLSMIKEDIAEDSESYCHGNENVEDIKYVGNGMGYEFYGYGCYDNYHIDYTAKEVNYIQNV